MAKRLEKPMLVIFLFVLVGMLVLSGIRPYDRLTWFLEIGPILIVVPILVFTHHRFPLSSLAYGLIFIHALILMIGGHYTYARVPLGFWAEDVFGFTRNHFDRLGHLAQGFIPAVVVREILLRQTPLKPGKMLFFVVVSVCLAVSAFYELIEWGSALVLGASATDFLGTQGDVWDTQWDMFLALLGALSSLVFLGRIHDKSMKKHDCPIKRS